jgi:integrase/recombinase XerC
MFTATFLNYLEYEKRYSKHTITAYANDLSQFAIFLSDTYKISNISDASHLHIRSWMVNMMEQNISPRSVNRKITCLKSYYKFLLKQEQISVSPMIRVQTPKNAKRLPVFVEESKMDNLFDNVQFGEGFSCKRDKLILEVFYLTGMRLSELINISENDVDLHSCCVKVKGKRNKERIIPFTNVMKKLIEEYLLLKKITFSLLDNNIFFVTDNGKQMYTTFVYRKVKAYLEQVTTIDKKSPHVLRHTFATHMLNHGADINAIKEVLGHANLSATQVYTHNTIEKLKSVYLQAHPRGD